MTHQLPEPSKENWRQICVDALADKGYEAAAIEEIEEWWNYHEGEAKGWKRLYDELQREHGKNAQKMNERLMAVLEKVVNR